MALQEDFREDWVVVPWWVFCQLRFSKPRSEKQSKHLHPIESDKTTSPINLKDEEIMQDIKTNKEGKKLASKQ